MQWLSVKRGLKGKKPTRGKIIMEKNMKNGLKFIPTSTVDIESASDTTSDVIFKNSFKDENGEPIKYFVTAAETGAGQSKPE